MPGIPSPNGYISHAKHAEITAEELLADDMGKLFADPCRL